MKFQAPKHRLEIEFYNDFTSVTKSNISNSETKIDLFQFLRITDKHSPFIYKGFVSDYDGQYSDVVNSLNKKCIHLNKVKISRI